MDRTQTLVNFALAFAAAWDWPQAIAEAVRGQNTHFKTHNR
jgi:hypothetical protein